MLLKVSNESKEKERDKRFLKMKNSILNENKQYIQTELEANGNNCLTHEGYEVEMPHSRYLSGTGY